VSERTRRGDKAAGGHPEVGYQQILVAADESRIDGYLGLERRLTLHQDEHAKITGLVLDAAVRRSGLGRVLVMAGERRAVQHGPVSRCRCSSATLASTRSGSRPP
jgi:ribosomal protein S18 acetylase RimI-like enzyme